MPKKTISYYGDFETSTVKIPKEYDSIHDMIKSGVDVPKPEVYSWVILTDIENIVPAYDIENVKLEKNLKKGVEYATGIDLSSFFKVLQSMQTDSEIWFNNSKGFDAHFMIYWLNNNGYLPFIEYDIKQRIDILNADNQTKLGLAKIWIYRYNRIKDDILSGNMYSKYYEKSKKTEEDLERAIKYQWRFLFYDEYKEITNENTQIYSLEFGITSRKRSNGREASYRTITIKDNLLLFPSSVKNMGLTMVDFYVNYFGLDPDEAYEDLTKKSIDYQRYEKYKSYEEFENDGNEKEYLIQDAYILYKWQESMKTFFPKKDWKMTIGATAYKDWTKRFGDSILDKFIKQNLVTAVIVKGFVMYRYEGKLYKSTSLKKLLINQLFPTEWMDRPASKSLNHHQKLYSYYNGGMVFINEKYRGKLVTNLIFVDNNSSFATQMNSEQMIPYGVGTPGNDNNKPFKMVRLDILKDIANPKGLPFLYNVDEPYREYPKVLKAGSTVYTNSIEMERFYKYYKSDKDSFRITIEYSFAQAPAKFFFGEFVEYWYKIKEQAGLDGNAVLRAIAKLFLNSLYGKFGTKSFIESKMYFDDEWHSFSEIQESKYYLPAAIAITSLARMMLVDAVGERFDQVIYGDTDSLLIKDFKPEDFPNIKFDESKLGYWGTDLVNGFGLVRRPKQYILYGFKKNKWIKKMVYSGINFNKYLYDDEELEEIEYNVELFNSFTINDFIYGREAPNQTKPERLVSWGIFIDTINKSVSPIWNYPKLTQQTIHTKEDYLSLFSQQSELLENMNNFIKIMNYHKLIMLSL